MSQPMSPCKPFRADHRLIRGILDSSHKGEVYHFPKEYDRVSQVFRKMGGNWLRIFGGDVEHICKLKDIVSYAVKHGYITKKPSWEKGDS